MMLASVIAQLVCDVCGNAAPDAHEPRMVDARKRASKLARAAGWRRVGKVDWCPTCVAARATANVAWANRMIAEAVADIAEAEENEVTE